ncbi:MAG: orotidine-5'-phosphate decarboxylase [Bacteriovoracia bacterium]
MPEATKAKTQLIVALDQLNEKQAFGLVDDLSSAGVSWFKVGLELFVKSGPELVKKLKAKKLRIFLDLKYHDIPNTVFQAVKSAVDLDVDLLTVHCTGGVTMLKAAAEAAQGSSTKVIGVTVLTSHSGSEFIELSKCWGVSSLEKSEAVQRFLEMAQKAAIHGVVCPVPDLEVLPTKLKEPGFLFVTPGIRFSENEMNDQRSTASPAAAVKAGSTHLVVGRPITADKSPAQAAQRFLSEIERVS